MAEWLTLTYIPDGQRQKLDKKYRKLRFVGYSKESKGYQLMDDKTSKVRVSRDVTFNETEFDHNAEQAVIGNLFELGRKWTAK